MVGIKHLREAGDAVIELYAAADVGAFEHILAENSAAVTDTGNGAHAHKTQIFKAGNVILQESMELLHQLMLFKNLAGDILRIGVMAVVAVEGEGNERSIVVRRVGDADTEEIALYGALRWRGAP